MTLEWYRTRPGRMRVKRLTGSVALPRRAVAVEEARNKQNGVRRARLPARVRGRVVFTQTRDRAAVLAAIKGAAHVAAER